MSMQASSSDTKTQKVFVSYCFNVAKTIGSGQSFVQ